MGWIWSLLLLWGSHPEAGGIIENPDPGEMAASAPVLAVDAGGNPGVAWESGVEDRRIRFALRGGNGWQTPVTLAEGPALEPRVCAAAGRWHVAWQTTGRRSGADAVRTSDGGRTWNRSLLTPPVDAVAAAIAAHDRILSQIALAADERGRVYAAWEEHSPRVPERDLYLVVSRDHGATWSVPVRIDSDEPGSASSFHPILSATDDGHLTVVWWDLRNGLADLYVRSSKDGGTSWAGPEERLDPGPPGEMASHDARLEQHRGELHLIWREGYGDAGVWMRRVSRDRGVTWNTARPAPDAREPVPGTWVVRSDEWEHSVRVAVAPGTLEYRRERSDPPPPTNVR